MVFWPSMVSRMMSAWPACWAVSAMMCRSTRRADQRAPGSNHGASGSGCAASRSGRCATSSSVRRGRPRRRRRARPPASRRAAAGTPPCARPRRRQSLERRASSPPARSRMKSAQFRSTAVTCLIRPPRVQLAGGGALPGLLVGEAAGGEAQEAAVLAQGLEQVGAARRSSGRRLVGVGQAVLGGSSSSMPAPWSRSR